MDKNKIVSDLRAIAGISTAIGHQLHWKQFRFGICSVACNLILPCEQIHKKYQANWNKSSKAALLSSINVVALLGPV
jgi:hypothetical protein